MYKEIYVNMLIYIRLVISSYISFAMLRCCLVGCLLILSGFVTFVASLLICVCRRSASRLLGFCSRSFLQVRCRCSALCLVRGALCGYQNMMQEAVPGIVRNEVLKDQHFFNNYKRLNSGATGGILGVGFFRIAAWSR